MKLYLSTPDIEAALKELKSKGVKPTHEITRAGWGTSFDFRDPDGNQWLVVQSMEVRRAFLNKMQTKLSGKNRAAVEQKSSKILAK